MSLDLEQAREDFVRDVASDALMADWARRYGSELLERARVLAPVSRDEDVELLRKVIYDWVAKPPPSRGDALFALQRIAVRLEGLGGRLSPVMEVATPVEARASLPLSDVTRLRAVEVLGDTDTWTGSDWQHAAVMLASAIVSVTGDLEKVEQT